MTAQAIKNYTTPAIGFSATSGAFAMKFIDMSQAFMEWGAVLIGLLIGIVTLAIQWKKYKRMQ